MSICLLAALFSLAWSLPGYASEYLGILAELTKPESEIAEQLVLTADQLSRLKQLTTRRTNEAVSLTAELKQAPVAEHSKLMANFCQESERLAAEILDPQQQRRLRELRLQWLGLTSLSDEGIATALNLADWQRKIVGEYREKLRVARKMNIEDSVKEEVERSIRNEISDSQWTAWQMLAGLLPVETEVEPPQPPGRNHETPPSSPTSGLATSQPPADVSPSDAGLSPIDQIQLQLNFQQQPWGDVIKWLASEADFSVHSETTPPGSFTYRDRSRTYSISETLDVMNAYLLDSGYALLRQGRMLRCINFEEDQQKRGELLKELTDTIDEQDLETRGRYEPVRVLFNLQRLDPDSIVEEVQGLLSVQGTAVSLVTSGQMLVTDMAGNVRNVAEFIHRAEDPNSARGAAVQVLPLKSINAEEVLTVARPLLELEADSNVSENIKISTNTFGTMIYARGDAAKIQILRDLIDQMDKPPEEADRPVAFETPYVGRHLVRGIDLKLAYEVAAQLLVGSPDVKLATDETAKQLVLMGRKADHEMVKKTLDELAGESSDFKVIPLNNLDTPMAIAAVKKFFNLPDKPEEGGTGPVIDGDAAARQIWVKGTQTQVQQIEDLIAKLESTAKNNRNLWGDHLRMIPLTGSSAANTLRQAQELWEQVYGSQNPIVVGDAISTVGGLKKKTFAPESNERSKKQNLQPATDKGRDKDTETQEATPDTKQPQPRNIETTTAASLPPAVKRRTSKPQFHLISAQQDEFDSEGSDSPASQDGVWQPNGSGPPIVIQEGPGGLMVSSEDPEALARFENLLRMIMDQSSANGPEPIVVYLKHISASAAKQLLTEILSGTSSSGSGDSLLGDMSMGGSSGGTSSSGSSGSGGLASGSYAIIANPHQNALFIKASPPDMRLIEQVLDVIDQPQGPISVETQGEMALIPVLTQDVTEVLNTVKTVFGDRVEGAGSSPAGGQAAPQPNQNPGDFFQAMRSAFGRGRSNGQPNARAEISEPKMSLGADTNSNTLIVVGQPYQIEQVRRLVEMLDEAGESEQDEIVVVDMGTISSPALSNGLKSVLGDRVQTNTSSSTQNQNQNQNSNSRGNNTSNGQFDADAARRRADFFQRMMQGQGGNEMRGGNSSGGGNRNSGSSNFGGRQNSGGRRSGGR